MMMEIDELKCENGIEKEKLDEQRDRWMDLWRVYRGEKKGRKKMIPDYDHGFSWFTEDKRI